MDRTPQQADAIRRISSTPEGRVFIAFLNEQLQKDYIALAMAEQAEQTRRLQGVARRMLELINLFQTSKAP